MTGDELNALEKLYLETRSSPWTSFVEGRDHMSGCDFIRVAAEDIELTGALRAEQDFIAQVHNAFPIMLKEIRQARGLISK